MIELQYKKGFSSTLHRCMVLVLLLLTFAIGVKAQKYYVIYYDEVKWNSTIRHYVSISEDGTSIVDETTLSSRCFWEAESELNSAVGQKGMNLKDTDDNTTNEENRKRLASVVFHGKCIVEGSGATEAGIKNGTVYSLNIKELSENTTVTPRWLIDNEIDGAPILYQYYHKQYLYYEYGWKYSSAGYKTGSVAKILAYDAIPNDLPSPSLTVTLDDREDHNWTYYSGVNRSVDNGYYNDNYKGKLYSPNPRNVKITYKANGGTVSLSESENEFVYYKTLEKDSTTGNYPYTIISNPFSKRPVIDGKVQGFNGWKIVSGGNYIKDYDNGAVLPLDAEIVFENLPYDNINCISAEIEFHATWVPAQVTYLASVKTDNTAYTFDVENSIVSSSTTYENNFLVINKTYSGTITVKSPCTIMMVEPDGSKDYRSNIFSKLITPMAGGNTKIEFVHWQPSGSINAQGRNFTIGRGMKMDGTTRALYGTNTASVNVDQILKVESGKFSTFTHYGAVPTSIAKQKIIYGCDYDRAKSDNSKLEFTGRLLVASAKELNQASGKELCRVYSLSGRFMTSKTVAHASRDESCYMCVLTDTNKGYRYLEIQGGEWVNIAGGMDDNTTTHPGFTFRMRGGHIKGSIYGAAEYLGSKGTRVLLITGGTINGWVAGGANGTRLTGGDLKGVSYVYVGGYARIDSKGSTDIINRAVGGNVFGAGCGYCSATSSTSGQVTLGTNVVISDNAYVERGVYGGGSYGYCTTTKTSNIYITGGTIDGFVGGVNANPTGGTVNSHAEYSAEYNPYILGGVYGGACQNKGGSVNIFMTGGTVNGGLYGGSNASGVLSGSVNMTITGGTVGTQDKTASVYGGGYGSSTAINKNINMTMSGGTVNGNLFGGGNEGAVKGNTNVTITGGEIKQNVYGGGNKAAVSGTTNVVIGQ